MEIKWKKLDFYTKLVDKPGEDSYYALVEKQTECIVKRGETEKEAINNSIKELEKKGLKKTKEAINYILDKTKNRKELLSEKVRDKFYAYFDISISQFIRPLLGIDIIIFDIVKFDNWLKPPKGVSCKDYATKKYGKKASNYIAYLNKL